MYTYTERAIYLMSTLSLSEKSWYITQKIIECSQILLPLLNRILINASSHSLRLQKFIYGQVVQSKLEFLLNNLLDELKFIY